MHRQGFTLVELLVVIAMIALLVGSMTSAIAKARQRARITATTASVQEITKAILAYANYGANGQDALSTKMTGGWTEASDGALGFITGNETMPDGSDAVVLYDGSLYDAWGSRFRYRIQQDSVKVKDTLLESGLLDNVFFPNFYRTLEN